MSLEYNKSVEDFKKINKICKRVASITAEEIESAIKYAESQTYYNHPLKMAKASKIQEAGENNLKVLSAFKVLHEYIHPSPGSVDVEEKKVDGLGDSSVSEKEKSQFREPSTQGGEEKIFLDSESTYSLMTSSDPEKVEKGKVLRVQELSLQLVKKNKRIQVLEEALRVVHDNDFSAMLKLVPEGIEHRADTYNSADQFEYAGSYEEDARYTSPARQKMISVFIEKALNPKD